MLGRQFLMGKEQVYYLASRMRRRSADISCAPVYVNKVWEGAVLCMCICVLWM